MSGRLLLVGGALVLATAGLLTLAWWPQGDSGRDARPSNPGAIPLAVVGDSGSHSYQDKISFPPGSPDRGGAFRPNTFQWTEIIARLRGKELDLGPWVDWGFPSLVAWARELVGMSGGRAPRKQDYLYNFANSGASCTNLLGVGLRQRFHQVPRLIRLMDRDPELWKNGIVVIRIGANDWDGLLDLQSRQPDAPELRNVADFCATQIRESVARIRASHPSTRIMVVGLANDSDDPSVTERWHSDEEIANLRAANDLFNKPLRKLVESVPNASFFDDTAWAEKRWFAHSSPKKPYHNTVVIGKTLAVTNTVGDDPRNALVEDTHGGLAWNALWAQSFVEQLRQDFKLPLTPISDDEVAAFVLPLVTPAQ